MVGQNPYEAFSPSWSIAESMRRLQHVGKSRDIFEKAVQLSTEFGISADLFDRNPRQLSGGQLQRFSFVRALIADPDILILDESMSGLDAEHIAMAKSIVDKKRSNRPFSIFMTEHSDNILRYFDANFYEICDRSLIEKEYIS